MIDKGIYDTLMCEKCGKNKDGAHFCTSGADGIVYYWCNSCSRLNVFGSVRGNLARATGRVNDE